MDSKAGKPIKLLAIPSGDVFEIEKTVDPYWLLADNLEELHYNRERYVDYKQCEKVISLDNGGVSRGNSARIIAEKKTIEKTKTLSRIAMGPECDGMVQTDFFDGAMAVLLEHPDVYLAGSARE